MIRRPGMIRPPGVIRRPGMIVRPGMRRRRVRPEEIRELRRRIVLLRQRHLENTRDFERLEELLELLLLTGYYPSDYDYDYNDGYDNDYSYMDRDRDRGRGSYEMQNSAQNPYVPQAGGEVPAMGQGHSGFYGFSGAPFGDDYPLDDQ
jgi:hypothetical protein